jgi:hypothetical protein
LWETAERTCRFFADGQTSVRCALEYRTQPEAVYNPKPSIRMATADSGELLRRGARRPPYLVADVPVLIAVDSHGAVRKHIEVEGGISELRAARWLVQLLAALTRRPNSVSCAHQFRRSSGLPFPVGPAQTYLDRSPPLPVFCDSNPGFRDIPHHPAPRALARVRPIRATTPRASPRETEVRTELSELRVG